MATVSLNTLPPIEMLYADPSRSQEKGFPIAASSPNEAADNRQGVIHSNKGAWVTVAGS
jgi:hypothetical protein